MAYFWEYITYYPVESCIIIGVSALIYCGWIKKFWYVYRPPLFCTKAGDWRIRRYIGRIVKFETEKGDRILAKSYAQQVEKQNVVVLIYIKGQPLRRMLLNNNDIWDIKRVPKRAFIKEYTMNKKYIVWDSRENAYTLTNDYTKIYLIKPEIFEKQILRKIDNIDIKSSRGSRVSPQIVHSGYFTQHLPLPEGEYEEKQKDLRVREYDYKSDPMGDYEEYGENEDYDDDEDEVEE